MFVIGPPQKEPTFTIMWRQSMLAPMGIFVIFVTSFVHQSMPLNFMNQDITENQKSSTIIFDQINILFFQSKTRSMAGSF